MQIQPVFLNAYDFKQGLCRARTGDKWGYFNTSGEFIIKPVYENAEDFTLIKK